MTCLTQVKTRGKTSPGFPSESKPATQAMMKDMREFLADMALFDGLPEAQLDAVAHAAVPLERPKGTLLFSEGDEAGGLYVALAGKVKIFKIAPDGREMIIHIYGPGEPFAEVPVFEGGSFPASAETLEDCRLLFLPRQALVRLLSGDPALAMNMLAALSRKLRRFTVQVENLTLKESPQRLAAYLLDVSERSGNAAEVELDMAKGHLAGLLGTAQETLSRILRKMSDGGLIAVSGRRIAILDRPAMEDLAAGEIRL